MHVFLQTVTKAKDGNKSAYVANTVVSAIWGMRDVFPKGYNLFEYVGSRNADVVLVCMCSSGATATQRRRCRRRLGRCAVVPPVVHQVLHAGSPSSLPQTRCRYHRW